MPEPRGALVAGEALERLVVNVLAMQSREALGMPEE